MSSDSDFSITRASPKSATFTVLWSPTSTFAARTSRWIKFWASRYAIPSAIYNRQKHWFTTAYNTHTIDLTCNTSSDIVIYIVPLLRDRGCIAKQSSVCFLVCVCRLEQKCFQLATKTSGRLQQLQFCQQPVPCSRCEPCRQFVDGSVT